MAKVKATVFFSSAAIGSKEKGDRFEYDMDNDPLGLKREGKVELVEKPAANKPAPGK